MVLLFRQVSVVPSTSVYILDSLRNFTFRDHQSRPVRHIELPLLPAVVRSFTTPHNTHFSSYNKNINMEDDNPFPKWPPSWTKGSEYEASAKQAEIDGLKSYCKPCKKWVKDEDALLRHKINDPKHILCYVCNKEFYTLEANESHQKQVCLISISYNLRL